MNIQRSIVGSAMIACALITNLSVARAFEEVGNEDILKKGPTMGPIDAERPPPKYLKKDTFADVTGISSDTKGRENFDQPTLDYNPIFVEALPRWGIELRFGPYRPQFSNQPAGRELYDLVMVNNDHKSWFHGRPIMLALEGDYYILRQFGLLGAYGRVGYWQASGPSRACVASDGVTYVPCSASTVAHSVAGNDTAGITDIPLSIGAVYRFDRLKKTTPVPVIFTAKIGLDGHLWFGTSGGKRARYNGHKAQGATLGWQASVGMSLNIDSFAKHALSHIRSRVENNLFVELATIRGHALIGPDHNHRLNFTDNRLITVGLACDFK